jgi:pimeloyl-ACP methyl ester carboxylesterase
MADDVSSALTFLAAQPSVDPGKIAVVAHSGGAMCAMEAAADTGQAKCLVLMAPVVKTVSGEEQVSAEIENTAKNSGWSKEYAALVAKTRKETEALAVNNSGSWAYILGKRCFLDETRRRITENPAEIIARLKVPVLILQGGNGSDPSIKSASYIDRLLADSGNPKHAIKYFDYLGPFMGGIVDDGIHRRYYEVDGEVLKSIKEWLDENL